MTAPASPRPTDSETAESAGRDTADLREAIDALSDSHERNQAILRALPDMMFVQSRDGTYLDYHAPDPAALLLPPERFLGRRMDDIMPPDLAARFHQAFDETLRTGQPAVVEYVLQMPEGERSFEARIVGCNEQQNLLAIVREITTRVAADASLRRAEAALAGATRLSWMGALAASLSHDINQPLTAIAANAAAGIHIVDDAPARTAPTVRELLAEIAASAQRAGHIIRRTLDVFAREPRGREPLHPADLVHAALLDADSGLRREGVAVRLDLASDLPPVFADRAMLLQVLLNLITNAVEAMHVVADRALTVSASSASGDEVVVAIADTGPGLDDRGEMIFEPFHTSRSGHIGIGLTISRAIVEAHGGTLRAVPSDRTGARFELRMRTKKDAMEPTPSAGIARPSV